MDNKQKAMLAAGAVIFTGIILMSKTGSQDIQLHIYDSEGNLIKGNPATAPYGIAAAPGPGFSRARIAGIGAIPSGLVEGGGPYTLAVTVHNTSVYTGTQTKAPYQFALDTQIGISGTMVLFNHPPVLVPEFGPDETRTISYPFSIPYGVRGNGVAVASLYTTAGATLLKNATPLSFTVTAAGVTPGGEIIF